MDPNTENPSTAVLGRATILMHKIKLNALTLHYCIITLINQYFIEGRSISNMHGVLNVGTVAFSDNAILGYTKHLKRHGNTMKKIISQISICTTAPTKISVVQYFSRHFSTSRDCDITNSQYNQLIILPQEGFRISHTINGNNVTTVDKENSSQKYCVGPACSEVSRTGRN